MVRPAYIQPTPPPKAPRATWEQHIAMAQYLYYEENQSPASVMEWFKAKQYVANGLKYEASRVSAVIAGIMTVPVTPVVSDPVGIINAQLTTGELKFTKAKLIHTPT